MFINKYNIIKSKINNISNNDFSLTEEEQIIFDNRSDLQELLVKTIENHPQSIKQKKLLKLFSLNKNLIRQISNAGVKDVFKNLIDYYFEEGIISLNTIRYYCSQYELGDEYLDYCIERYEEFCRYSNNINIVNEVQLRELLERKRFDVITKCNNYIELDDSLNDFLSKWPRDLEFPPVLLKNLEITYLDSSKISYEYLISSIIVNYENSNFINILKTKINNNQKINEIKLTAKEQFKLFSNIKDNEIIEFLYKNKILNFNKINEVTIIYFIENMNDLELLSVFNYIEQYCNQNIIDNLIEFSHFIILDKLKYNFKNNKNIITNKIMLNKILCNLRETEYINYLFYIPNDIPNDIRYEMVDNMQIELFTINEGYTINDLEFLEIALKNNPNIKVEYYFNVDINSKLFQILLKYNKIDLEDYKFEELINNKFVQENMDDNYTLANYIISNFNFDNSYILDIISHDLFLSELAFNKLINEKKLPRFNLINKIVLNKINFNLDEPITLERLNKLYEFLGNDLIYNWNNENMVKLYHFSDFNLDKFINLFPKLEYTMNDLEAAYDSIEQFLFANNNHDLFNLAIDLEKYIDKKNISGINKIINLIVKDLTIDDINKVFQNGGLSFRISSLDFVNQIDKALEKNDLTSVDFLKNTFDINNITIDKQNKCFRIKNIKVNNVMNFLNLLVHECLNGSSIAKIGCIDVLYNITQKYIAVKREYARETYMSDFKNKIHLDTKYNRKDFEEEFLNCFYEEFYNNWESNNIEWNNFKLKLLDEGLDENLIYESLLFKRTRKNSSKKVFNCLNIIKQYALKELYLDNVIPSKIIRKIKDRMDYQILRKEYYLKNTEYNVWNLIKMLNLDNIKSEILNNALIYNSLVDIMTAKKIHLLPQCLKDYIESVGLLKNCESIAVFINNYASIVNNYKEISFKYDESRPNNIIKFVDIITLSNAYSSISSIYSSILTQEVENLIRVDPGVYSSKTNNPLLRLNQSVEFTYKMFLRSKVTVPSFKEIFEINNKKINVTLGNFTNPNNLIHGEKTNSCMRINGLGKDFFAFCLTNENGFNIEFKDAITEKYISKISGFRNGNTVFLSSLMHSVNKDFKDDELIEITKLIAKMIIDKSKDSSYPIENVVISNTEAFYNKNYDNIDLRINDSRAGYPLFHCDILYMGILLASSNNDELVPIKLGHNNMPTYLPARNKVYEYENEITFKANEKIIRLDAIKKILNGEDYRYIDIMDLPKMKYSAVGDDWYIYVDTDNKIHSDIIDLDKRADLEFDKYLDIAKKKVGNIYEQDVRKNNTI